MNTRQIIKWAALVFIALLGVLAFTVGRADAQTTVDSLRIEAVRSRGFIRSAETSITATINAHPNADSMRVRAIRSRGAIRAAETQLTKVLGLIERLPPSILGDTVIRYDTVHVLAVPEERAVRPEQYQLRPGESTQLCSFGRYADPGRSVLVSPGLPVCAERLTAFLAESQASAVTSVRVYPREGRSDRLVGARIEGSDDGETWATLTTINETLPQGTWTIVPIPEARPYRFVRLLTPSGHGNLAELRFVSGAEVLAGAPIGTPGSWSNLPDRTIAAAYDNDLATFVDTPSAEGWVGLDLGGTP